MRNFLVRIQIRLKENGEAFVACILKTVTKVFSAFLVRVHSCFSSGSPKGESGSGPPTFRKEGSRHLQRNVINCTSGGVRQICREVVFEVLEKQGENHDYVKVWYSKLLDF